MNKKTAHTAPEPDHEPPVCGLARRLAAMLYDGLLLVGLWMVATLPLIVVIGEGIDAGNPWFRLYLLTLAWAYLAICWLTSGQTLGMAAWRMRLVGDTGPVTVTATLIRFLVALAGLLAAGLGFVWSLFNQRRAAWHDLASGTHLIVEKSAGRRTAKSQ